MDSTDLLYGSSYHADHMFRHLRLTQGRLEKFTDFKLQITILLFSSTANKKSNAKLDYPGHF